MKNKEIEILLEYLKDEKWEYYPSDLIPYKVLLMEERDLLLSYIEQLENKYDKALETLVDFNTPCERDDFNLLDTDYCELNCSNDDEQYKRCWNRWIEWRLENETNKRNVN